MKVTREEFLGSDADESIDVLRARVELLDDINKFLRGENAKLRDLVREMLICEDYLVSDAFDWYGCEGCPLHAGECNFKVRAKDFGIEVPDERA